MSTPADWSLPAASFIAPVLGSDQSACPANENYILISRPSCPTNGVHFTRAQFAALAAVVHDAYATIDRLGPASSAMVRDDLATRHVAELVDDLLPPIVAGVDQP